MMGQSRSAKGGGFVRLGHLERPVGDFLLFKYALPNLIQGTYKVGIFMKVWRHLEFVISLSRDDSCQSPDLSGQR